MRPTKPEGDQKFGAKANSWKLSRHGLHSPEKPEVILVEKIWQTFIRFENHNMHFSENMDTIGK